MKLDNCKTSDKCSQDFITTCNSSGLFNLSNIICPNFLPAECNQTIASSVFGDKWMQYCGIWVVNNILGDRCRISIKRTINLCQVVNISNTNFFKKYKNVIFRRELIASSSDIIPSSQDPTINDTVAIIPSSEIISTSAAINISGSTTTTIRAATDNDVVLMDTRSNTLTSTYSGASLGSNSNKTGGSKILEVGFIIALISFLI